MIKVRKFFENTSLFSMTKLYISFCSILFCSSQLYGQTSLKGTVIDELGAPLVGVNISVKSSSEGTVTDAEGDFVLSTKKAFPITLIVSYIGYEKLEIVVGDAKNLRIVLKEDTQALGEVVVVGIGYSSRANTSVVGNVVTIGAPQLKDKASANVMDALQGRVAGLLTLSSSGEPSGSSSFRLHGVGSLGASSTPLVVVDGAPIDGGSLMAINPNDIESFSVLKDAASTSIYGSRAANGVIFITTKQGKYNQTGKITVRGLYGISSMANKDYFNKFLTSDELANLWVETGYRTQKQVDDLRSQYSADTKWLDVYYKDKVPAYQGDLVFNGGSEKIRYYVSGSLYHSDGIAYRSNYNRYSVRTNLEARTNKWLKFGINTSLAYSDRNTNGWGANSTSRGLFFLTQPFYSPTDPETGERYDYIPGANKYHPEYLAEKNPASNNDLQLNGTFYSDITPLKGLTIHSQANIDAYDQRVTGIRLPSYSGSLRNGAASEGFYRNYLLTFTNTAEYEFDIDKHNIALLGGHEFIKANYTDFSGSSEGQTDDRLLLLGNGPNSRSVSSGHSEYAFLSWFGRLDYAYDETYFLNLNLRRDYSSRFGKENRGATFYSVGGYVDLRKLTFLEDNSIFSEMKLRTSYGTSGNASIGDYTHLATVSTTQYDGTPGWQIGGAGNSALKWETQSIFSVSLTTEIFEKLKLDLDYYDRATTNMLMSVPFPYTSGFSDISSNVGKLGNKGVDITLEYSAIHTKDWFAGVHVNFNYNQNKVLELFQGREQWTVANTGVSYVVGKPVCFYYPIFKGIDPEDGMQVWYLPGDDTSITQTDDSKTTKTFSSTALEQYTGKLRQAPVNGGFGFEVGYKGLSLQSHFAFVLGKWLISNDDYFAANPSNFAGYNQKRDVLDYWKNPGDVVSFPKYGQVRQFDTHLLSDASFMRLKELRLGYAAPESLLKKQNAFKGATLYVTARNFLTFTKYEGPDPEIDSNLTYGAYPNSQEIAFGFELSF